MLENPGTLSDYSVEPQLQTSCECNPFISRWRRLSRASMSNIKVARFLSHIRVVRLQECEMLFPHSPEPIWWLCWRCLICNGKYVVNGFAVRVRYRMDLSLTGFRTRTTAPFRMTGEWAERKGRCFSQPFCANFAVIFIALILICAG